MPAIPEELFMQGLKELVKLDAKWVPAIRTGEAADPHGWMMGI